MADTLSPKQQQLLDKIIHANIATQKRLGMLCIAAGLVAFPIAMITCYYVLDSLLDGFIFGALWMLLMMFLGAARLGYARLYEIIQKLNHDLSGKDA